MIDGKCPRCGSEEVYEAKQVSNYRDCLYLSLFSHVWLQNYICCDCGLVESYLRYMDDVNKIKEKCRKVYPK